MDDNAREAAAVMPHKTGWLTFSGRVRRREYWWKLFLLTSVTVGFIITVSVLEFFAKVIYRITVPEDVRLMFAVALILVTLVCSVFYIPVAVRRLHDCGLSGWWCLLCFSVYPVPPDVPIGNVISIVFMGVIGCMDGTCGPNRFGPDPKGREPPDASPPKDDSQRRFANDSADYIFEKTKGETCV